MRNKFVGLVACISAFAVGVGCASAADSKPAVGGVNGKMDVSGGSVGLEASGAIAGSLSFPVSHSYGIQLDTGFTETASSHGGGFASHFFRRDPDSYLVGVTSMWARFDGRDIWRNGLEAEFYSGDFTFSPSAGIQLGLGNSTGYASLEAGYYATPDLLFNVGIAGYSDYRSPYVSTEWRPMEDRPLSLFAEAGAGNSGGGFGIAGLRFSFGVDGTSLKKQHREYDPPNILGHFVNGGGGGGGIMSNIRKQERLAPAPAPDFC